MLLFINYKWLYLYISYLPKYLYKIKDRRRTMKTKLIRHELMGVIKTGSLALILIGSLSNCNQSLEPKENSTITYEEGKAGLVAVSTVEMTAIVRAVDITLRTLTLEGPDGEEVNIRVGPDAVNFKKIQVNDKVKVTVAEELIVSVNKKGEKVSESYEKLVMVTSKDAKKPAGVAAETTIATADVVAIDQTKRTATLKFKDGKTKTFSVRDDVDLSQHKVGEQVVFQMTEMVAIRVEKVQ
jgi:hypothetical protein